MLSRYVPAALVMALAVALAACGGGSSRSQPIVFTLPPDLRTITAVPPPPLETLARPATVTSDGLQIIDIKVGDGQEVQVGDSVDVLYHSWFADGTFYDTTDVDNTPTPTIEILRKGAVLQGFVEGIPGMKVGGKRRLVIPPALAYGSQGLGNSVPPNTTLIYDIELVQVVRHS